MKAPLPSDARAAISYVDVVLTFAVLIMIAAVAPMIFNIYDMVQGVADPLTVALIALVVPMLIIGLIVSMGVAARS